MKLSEQVCTLEQAKRLAELGIAQGGYFRWTRWANRPWGVYYYELRGTCETGEYTAFTVAELGVMLPGYYATWYGNTNMGEMGWIVCSLKQIDDWHNDPAPMERYDTEAEARAALLIHLLETGAITAAEVNARLAA